MFILLSYLFELSLGLVYRWKNLSGQICQKLLANSKGLAISIFDARQNLLDSFGENFSKPTCLGKGLGFGYMARALVASGPGLMNYDALLLIFML